MTTPLSAWTGQLPIDVELDSGVLYFGASVFSATDGGLKFDPGKTVRDIPFDGRRSKVKLLDRTVDTMPVISGTIMEVPSTAFSKLEPGATTGTVAGGPSGASQLVPKPAGVLYVAGDYLSNVRAIWQRGDGTYLQIRFFDALVEKWTKTGKDKEEVKYEISIGARLDMTVTGRVLGDSPYAVEYFSVAP